MRPNDLREFDSFLGFEFWTLSHDLRVVQIRRHGVEGEQRLCHVWNEEFFHQVCGGYLYAMICVGRIVTIYARGEDLGVKGLDHSV